MRQITIPEFHADLKAQGVSAREHAAFKCCICGTVQSMASLKHAGCPDDRIENQIGFSCEGRWSKAGPWPRGDKAQEQRRAQTDKRGCDWTLGGLLRIHSLEVLNEEGDAQPIFEPATAEEAQELEKTLASMPARESAS